MTALYGSSYTETALKYLETAPPKIRGQIKKKIEMLAKNPNPQGCKKLHGVMDGEDPVYRVRSGDYRILYVVRNNPSEIIILDIGNRKDIYR